MYIIKYNKIYPPGNQHIPPWEKENHLQNAILGGYVSSLEGKAWPLTVLREPLQTPRRPKTIPKLVVESQPFFSFPCVRFDLPHAQVFHVPSSFETPPNEFQVFDISPQGCPPTLESLGRACAADDRQLMRCNYLVRVDRTFHAKCALFRSGWLGDHSLYLWSKLYFHDRVLQLLLLLSRSATH